MLEAGAIAPDFTLPGLDGQPWKLSDALQKGRVLLAFFKISCPTCQLTMPFLNRLGADSGLQVMAISQDDAGATRDFNKLFHAAVPDLLDVGPQYGASNAYRITNVPSLFVVETDRRISKSFSGFSKADLESLGVSFRADEKVPAMKPG